MRIENLNLLVVLPFSKFQRSPNTDAATGRVLYSSTISISVDMSGIPDSFGHELILDNND